MNIRIVILFALSFLFSGLPVSGHGRVSVRIEAEKNSNNYELGEPIEFNLCVQNFSKDTVGLLIPFFAGGSGNWVIKKGRKRIYSGLSIRLFDGHSILQVPPGQRRNYLISPLNQYNFDPGKYKIGVLIKFNDGSLCKSNKLKINVLEPKSKEIYEAFKGTLFSRSSVKVESGLAFLTKYPKSHFIDDVILNTAKEFKRSGEHQRGIELLKKIEDDSLRTSQYQRNMAFWEMGGFYEKLGKKEEAVKSFKRIIPQTSYLKNRITILQKVED